MCGCFLLFSEIPIEFWLPNKDVVKFQHKSERTLPTLKILRFFFKQFNMVKKFKKNNVKILGEHLLNLWGEISSKIVPTKLFCKTDFDFWTVRWSSWEIGWAFQKWGCGLRCTCIQTYFHLLLSRSLCTPGHQLTLIQTFTSYNFMYYVSIPLYHVS